MGHSFPFPTPDRRLARVLLAALLLALAILPAGQPVQAHPADMYLQTHTVSLTPTGLETVWRVTPGAMLAFLAWSQADTDEDSFISDQEAIDWAAPRIPELVAVVDEETVLGWDVLAITWPESLAEFEQGTLPIEITMRAAWPEGLSGAHDFILYSRFEETTSINWYYLSGEDGVQFTRPDQQNGLLRLTLDLSGEQPAPEGAAWFTAWDSGMPSLGASGGVQVSQGPPVNSASATLTGLVSQETLSLPLVLAALGIAIVLGAIHALTPGHGKTLVAAYLVGTRGTARHAAALGTIVTLTHTGSVLALGFLTLLASQYVLPSTIFPVLEVASGLLIVGMGVVLLWRRWVGWRSVRRLRARQQAAASAPPAPAAPASGTRTIEINQPIAAREYDAVLSSFDAQPEDQTRVDSGTGPGTRRLSWRALVTLGISGGLVPCPDAIAILLVAVAINRLALGLSMVVAFSVGLAAILIAIGLAMVQSRRLAERFSGFDRIAPALPMLSAVIVLLLGVTLTVNALTRAGIPGIQQPESPGATTLAALGLDNPASTRAYDLDTAEIVYVVPVEQGIDQLFVGPLNGGTARQLTDDPLGINGYALSPDGTTVVTSATRPSRDGTDISLIDLASGEAQTLLECPEGFCQGVIWAPDGSKLAYERLNYGGETSATLNPTSIWWLDPASGETGPVFQDTALPGVAPRWSPDGAWLSYVAAGTTGMQVYNLTDGRNITLTSLTGTAAIWRPTGGGFLMTDISPQGQRYLTHLLYFDLETETLTDLTGDGDLEDSEAVWSPDGAQIALARRDLGGGNNSPGNQVWIMAADGTDARPLVELGETIYQGLAWTPDGAALIATRYTLNEERPQPQLVLIDVATGDLRMLGITGRGASWLP